MFSICVPNLILESYIIAYRIEYVHMLRIGVRQKIDCIMGVLLLLKKYCTWFVFSVPDNLK